MSVQWIPVDDSAVLYRDSRLPERFWAKVRITVSGCWEWIGARNSRGYGSFGWQGKAVSTHRLVLLVGPGIPDGLQPDHLCQNKPCCNPAHLEVVTPRVNVQRACAKAVCVRGHRLAGDNLRISKRGRRQCVECCREDNRSYRLRRKQSA